MQNSYSKHIHFNYTVLFNTEKDGIKTLLLRHIFISLPISLPVDVK